MTLMVKSCLSSMEACFEGSKLRVSTLTLPVTVTSYYTDIVAAQDVGAVGVIIFTDPGDDGEFTEANGYTPYPDGPARQPSSVQRGSVQFVCPVHHREYSPLTSSCQSTLVTPQRRTRPHTAMPLAQRVKIFPASHHYPSRTKMPSRSSWP